MRRLGLAFDYGASLSVAGLALATPAVAQQYETKRFELTIVTRETQEAGADEVYYEITDHSGKTIRSTEKSMNEDVDANEKAVSKWFSTQEINVHKTPGLNRLPITLVIKEADDGLKGGDETLGIIVISPDEKGLASGAQRGILGDYSFTYAIKDQNAISEGPGDPGTASKLPDAILENYKPYNTGSIELEPIDSQTPAISLVATTKVARKDGTRYLMVDLSNTTALQPTEMADFLKTSPMCEGGT